MYKAPIEMLIDNVGTRVRYDTDMGVLRAVLDVGINVDKDELIRALEYDRGQYEKGFHDGVESVQKWIPVDDRLPEQTGLVLVCDTRENYFSAWEYLGNGLWYYDEIFWYTDDITHWMPLPEPPKEG